MDRLSGGGCADLRDLGARSSPDLLLLRKVFGSGPRVARAQAMQSRGGRLRQAPQGSERR